MTPTEQAHRVDDGRVVQCTLAEASAWLSSTAEARWAQSDGDSLIIALAAEALRAALTAQREAEQKLAKLQASYDDDIATERYQRQEALGRAETAEQRADDLTARLEDAQTKIRIQDDDFSYVSDKLRAAEEQLAEARADKQAAERAAADAGAQLVYWWEQTGLCPCGAREGDSEHVGWCPTAQALAAAARLKGEPQP